MTTACWRGSPTWTSPRSARMPVSRPGRRSRWRWSGWKTAGRRRGRWCSPPGWCCGAPPPRPAARRRRSARARRPARLAQGRELLALAEHGAEIIAARGDAVQHRPDREAIGPQRRVIELVPADRRRDRRARCRARAVGRDEGLVVDVLGVVEPGPAAALALVPFPAHQVGHDRSDLFGQLLGPGAGVAEAQP